MKKTKLKEQMAFLYPLSLIKSKSFTKRDVVRIKNNIASNTAVVRLIAAILLYAFAMMQMIVMSTSTGGNQIGVYGLTSVVAQIVAMFGCLGTIFTIVPTFLLKNKK